MNSAAIWALASMPSIVARGVFITARHTTNFRPSGPTIVISSATLLWLGGFITCFYRPNHGMPPLPGVSMPWTGYWAPVRSGKKLQSGGGCPVWARPS